MKFIRCFDADLKDQLLDKGFKLVKEYNGLFIFENNANIKFNINEVDKTKAVLTNSLFF